MRNVRRAVSSYQGGAGAPTAQRQALPGTVDELLHSVLGTVWHLQVPLKLYTHRNGLALAEEKIYT